MALVVLSIKESEHDPIPCPSCAGFRHLPRLPRVSLCRRSRSHPQQMTFLKVSEAATESTLSARHISTDGVMWFEHNEELVAVRHAFYKACEELGIGPEDGDKERREQLEQV